MACDGPVGDNLAEVRKQKRQLLAHIFQHVVSCLGVSYENSSDAMKALDATLLLRHIKIVQQSRELVSAIRSHTTQDNIGFAETVLDSSLEGDTRKKPLTLSREL